MLAELRVHTHLAWAWRVTQSVGDHLFFSVQEWPWSASGKAIMCFIGARGEFWITSLRLKPGVMSGPSSEEVRHFERVVPSTWTSAQRGNSCTRSWCKGQNFWLIVSQSLSLKISVELARSRHIKVPASPKQPSNKEMEKTRRVWCVYQSTGGIKAWTWHLEALRRRSKLGKKKAEWWGGDRRWRKAKWWDQGALGSKEKKKDIRVSPPKHVNAVNKLLGHVFFP